VVEAKVSIHVETLVISPVALFLSIATIALLIFYTIVIYLVQNNQLKLLPRNFDSPASVLATVYASEKLYNWAEQQHERRKLVDGEARSSLFGEAITARMSYFTGVDGKDHWDIELADGHAPLLMQTTFEDDQPLVRNHATFQHQAPSQDEAAPQMTEDQITSQ
jgi:glutathionylspermidine synthase